MTIRTFILKIINNETKYLTHHEIIDCTAHKFVSVIAQMCKEIKLWIYPTLQRLNFSFTYSFKFTYIDHMYVDKWTLKKDILLKKIIISSSHLRSREALRKLLMQFKNCLVNFISEWYLLRIMFFLVQRRATETLKDSKKTGRKKHWKMKRKKNEECRESQVTTINIFAFTFNIKNHFLVENIVWKK